MQTLSIVNHIRSVVGADPIDPENLGQSKNEAKKSKKEKQQKVADKLLELQRNG